MRTVLTLFISLFTTRVLMDALGVSSFGLFNLVAGIVTVFSFLQGSMMSATLRYLTYELGAGDTDRLRRTFATSLALHGALALISIVLAETVGLWIVNSFIDIPAGQQLAANVVYQAAIVSVVFSIIQVPYTSAIMARERLDAYAIVMVLQAVLRLGIAYLIMIAPSGRLVLYGILYAAVSLAIFLIYGGYALRFAECRCRPRFDKSIGRSVLTFFGFDTYGTFCSVVRQQGIAVILNRFGSTVLNAAASVAFQVNSALQSFSGTILLAFKPQIVKEYAAGNYGRSCTLMNSCGKYASLLVGMLMVPLYCEIDYVLELWLAGDVPAWTADFCRLCLITACFETLLGTSYSGIHATGNVKTMSLIAGTLWLAETGMAWLALRQSAFPPIVYAVHLVVVLGVVFSNTMILRRQMPAFNVRRFWIEAALLPSILTMVTMGACLAVRCLMSESFGRLVVLSAVSMVVMFSLAYAIDAGVRSFTTATMTKVIDKFRRHTCRTL